MSTSVFGTSPPVRRFANASFSCNHKRSVRGRDTGDTSSGVSTVLSKRKGVNRVSQGKMCAHAKQSKVVMTGRSDGPLTRGINQGPCEAHAGLVAVSSTVFGGSENRFPLGIRLSWSEALEGEAPSGTGGVVFLAFDRVRCFCCLLR